MLKTIDLFAGAGGLSLGFKQTGRFELVAAAEIKTNARQTYAHNIPDKGKSFEFIENVIGYDFEKLNEKVGGIDVVIGGPPCQGFSNANRQKSSLISLNNALVKEYFRAIKEIRPKAFVMENVSMLKSNVHRFYDSERDHDIIEALNATSKDPKNPKFHMLEEEIVLAEREYDGFDLLKIAKDRSQQEALIIPDELFHLLYVLNKNKNNNARLPKYIKLHSKRIRKLIDAYCENHDDEDTRTITLWLESIKEALVQNRPIQEVDELQNITEFQKMLLTMTEIHDNHLIGLYSSEKHPLSYKVKSYAVIDYVNAILGDDYIQHGATLNAVCFGVPQERRRHIVIGIRRDCLNNASFEMIKNPEDYTPVTVGEAIADLAEYEVSTESECTGIPYSDTDVISKYAAAMRENSSSVKNHFATSTTDTAKKRFEAISQGKGFLSLPAELKTTYSKPERTQKTIYLRLDPKKPSGTVVNVRKSMWIHPEKDRAISLREAARLQSFPDSFEFKGTKDSQYQQVGNAVPPLLAKNIAEYLQNIIE